LQDMSSKNKAVACEKCMRVPFRLSALHRYVPERIGVYGFWFGGYCIYIGKTESQSLQKRLTDHWNGSHNYNLNLWINAKRDKLHVAFIEIANCSEISRYETYYIKFFQPLTNKIKFNKK
jgi:hypothetical protein